jgi:ATP-dependent exoDNAse (exonuclease V) beta subunit
VTAPADAAAREQIARQLDRTLFVEAGAGSGKTTCLVNRVVATVLEPSSGVPLRHVAAVTFTEKAAAQLRDRLRAAFERRGATAPSGSWEATAAAQALDDLDTAAIGTLHSFAKRILAEHPIEAGLPPLVEVRDEVSSGVAFDDRWAALRAELLDDPDLADVLPLALAAGVRLDDLRSMAAAFTDNWDLLADRILATPPDALPTIDADTIVADARRLAAQAERCTDGTDKFLPRLTGLGTWAARLAEAGDDAARLAVLADAGKLSWSYGRRRNWSCDLAGLKEQCADLATTAAAIRDRVLDVALRRLAARLARATLHDARVRRAEGRLEFHDLLVLARDLLRGPVHGPAVRAALQQRYRRLLLDEFQDTDPIQIDLAVRVAGGAPAEHTDWVNVDVPPASLFVVGDPKQSIYRFRRADIATYLAAQQHLGAEVVLDTNFRTGAPVLDWVNHVFAQLITAVPDSQPTYRPVRAHRPAAPSGPPVLALGVNAHADNPSADVIRTREAADVAATVRAALTERWQVHDDTTAGGGWRDVELRDIAVLVPARTSVAHLEAAFDAANIGYHSEASSLVYRTREVRDLLAAARAADDPSDPLALVTALRSPLFGCGDDDLWTWYRAGGRWNLLAPPPEAVPAGHPVAQAVAYLRRLHDDRTWLAPSEILTRLVDDRRMFEVATVSARSERSEPRSREPEASTVSARSERSEPRSREPEASTDAARGRDVWRRLRFVIDQARAWSDAEHAGLRGYLGWATRQGSDSARVAEAVLPETDADTLRIMTVHAAKGLEFPVVIATGMTSRPGGARSGIDVLWPRDGGCQFKFRKDLRTMDFDVAKPVDEQMDHHERLRLLYVACTRARDHLVVSLHRGARPPGRTVEDRNRTNAELLAGANAGAPSVAAFTAEPPSEDAGPPRPVAVQPPPPLPQWRATMDTVRARAARPAAVSASQLEGTLKAAAPRAAATDRLGEPADAGLAKDARDLELPPWNKGRYGTAIGRAVHGVLQTVDLTTGADLVHAVAAQVIAEGVADHADLVTQLARSALASEVVRHAATREHWRETYVGTIVGDRVLDGVIDLLYRDRDGLVVVDYKTDAAPTAALDRRVDYYRPQMAAYALAVAAATGETVARGVLLFLTPTGAHERHIDLAAASAQVRDAVLAG